MEKEKLISIAIIATIFAIVLAIRLDIAFGSDYGDFVSYDALRQVESIRSTGIPLYHDPLSFGGRDRVFAPLFYYLLAACSFLVKGATLVKLVPNVLAASVVIPTYHLTRYMTSNKAIAYVSSLIAGLVPAAFLIGINDASPMTLSVTLLFTAAYLFLKSRRKGRHLNWLIIVLVALPFIDALSAILVVGLFIYLLLLKIEGIKTKGKEVELSLFLLFYTGWTTLILFKKALLVHGTSVIWQNIPSAQLSQQFSQFTLIEAISSTGLIPLIVGSIGLYSAISHTKKKSPIFLVSIITSCALMLWFRLIPLTVGLYVFSITLAIASGYGFHEWFKYLRKTKAARIAHLAIAGTVIIFLLLSISSWSYESNDPQESDIVVLDWARENLDDAVILAPAELGFFIEYQSGQKTVIDEDFLLIPRVEERYDDTTGVYRDFFTTDAISTMERYGAKYLYVNKRTRNITGVKTPVFIEDDCFDIVAEKGFARLVEQKCELRESQ